MSIRLGFTVNRCQIFGKCYILVPKCQHTHNSLIRYYHKQTPFKCKAKSNINGNKTGKSKHCSLVYPVVNERNFSSTPVFHANQGYKIKNNLRDCYSLLNISEDCSLAELKEAYIKLAKVYHPDSQSPTADPKKFDQVKEAYQTVKARLEEQATLDELIDDDDDEDDDLFSTKMKPQHRQYLDKEGVGFGTKQERQKQYDQYRINRAQNKVIDYKIKRLTPEGDNALVVKDKKATRRNKIRSEYEHNDVWLQVRLDRKRNSMERIVEDLIQDAMSRGDFSNLSGTGKPLKRDQDSPYMDKITKKLNQILIDENSQPEWIMMQKEIRTDMDSCRQRLAVDLKRLGEPPLSDSALKHRDHSMEQFSTSIGDINSRIDKFNLICPILTKQMVHYQFQRERDKVCKNLDIFLPADFEMKPKSIRDRTISYSYVDDVSMKQIWSDFKNIFRKSENS